METNTLNLINSLLELFIVARYDVIRLDGFVSEIKRELWNEFFHY
jgi:hypothetical protein